MILYTFLSGIGIVYLCFLIGKSLKKSKQQYQAPRVIHEWICDDPEGELYVAFITSDQKVWSAGGRYAHSSGSTSTTWSGFLSGDLNDLVLKTMGQQVLEEMIEYLKQQK
ncbi:MULTISPECIES: hypothetical protein [Acinetobacter]|uniref:hypothetical protein n=1 Tax=Acinetobacter TaxID=469 RepID=UPI00244A5128|nr:MULTISPECIES: hypothetical protein [Acinetobacter]MDH0032467.1 hypothetical protein [Acinetobacter sp. GD04021]MDH0888002.1 hypothetical protein [Acinetobacter sp. GD03873]MDH1084342.1 hypothetical protein [Acinetobacter sp. GD03983]MDH2191374.1 hypothetical protein [Acinetobacter sp. GD03645]MDH2204912.1 hypothetical protein [Acinetobacter sp. GD03647]